MTAASNYIDPALIAQAIAAQGAGSDGRTVLSGPALASVLKQLSGVTATPGSTYSQYQDQGQNGGDFVDYYNPGSYTDASGNTLYGLLGPQYQGAYTSQADYQAQLAAKEAQMGLDPSKTYLTSQFDNPTGNGSKDQATGYYTLDANGNAVPVGGDNRYSPGSWVGGGRQAAANFGAVLTAGALGGAFSGAAAGDSTGAVSGMDLAADAPVGAGNNIGTAAGAFNTGGGGALEGDYLGAGGGSGGDIPTAGSESLPVDAGSAPAYGGPGTSGAGAGADAVVNGTAGTTTALTAQNAMNAAKLAGLLGSQGGNGTLGTALAGAGAALVNGSHSTNVNTPNYQQAATAQGQSARTNQTNPYGSLTYQQTGTDAQGNPIYSQNVALNSQGQSNLNSAQQAQGAALGGLNSSISGYGAAMKALPGLYGDTGSQSGLTQQAINSMYHQQTALLDPQYQQNQQALTSQLANQGISLGSQAYNTAMNNFAQQRDYAYGNARDSSINQGNALANQLFNQNLSAHTTGANDLTTQLNNYQNAATSSGNTANSLNPSFAATPAATNYLGAAALQGTGNLQQYNATTGANNSTTNGLFNLGGAVLSNPGLMNTIGNLFSTGGG